MRSFLTKNSLKRCLSGKDYVEVYSGSVGVREPNSRADTIA